MNDESEVTREPTFGEKAVGLSFNPSANPMVAAIKQEYAVVIDRMDCMRRTSDNAELKRMCSVAITEAQTAQMWAVKAATWRQ